jgi:hypothetical protein
MIDSLKIGTQRCRSVAVAKTVFFTLFLFRGSEDSEPCQRLRAIK